MRFNELTLHGFDLQIRRLSDEDISKVDMTSNVLNNMKSQATNGINLTPEKKLDGPNNIQPTNELIENEVDENCASIDQC